MKKKTVIFGASALALLIAMGMVRQVLSQRNEVIQLPMDAVETAVDHTLSQREQQAQVEAQAQREFIERDELLVAHETIKIALSEWQGLRDSERCIRATELYDKFVAWKRESGKSLEVILAEEFAAELQRVDQWHRSSPGVHGDASAIAEARARRGDIEALLYLADRIYSGEAVPICQDSYAIEIARLAQVFGQVQARVQRTEQNMNALRQERLAQAQQVWDQQPPAAQVPPTEAPAPEAVEGQSPDTEAKEAGVAANLKEFFYGDE